MTTGAPQAYFTASARKEAKDRSLEFEVVTMEVHSVVKLQAQMSLSGS